MVSVRFMFMERGCRSLQERERGETRIERGETGEVGEEGEDCEE